MGLFYLEEKDRYCIYDFKQHKVLKELFGGEKLNLVIDNTSVIDVLAYKNKNWYLEKSKYMGQDLNGLDIVEEENFFTLIKKLFKKLLVR